MKLYEKEMIPAIADFSNNLSILNISEEVKKTIQAKFDEVVKVALESLITLDPTEYHFTRLEHNNVIDANATTPKILQTIRNDLPLIFMNTVQGGSLPKVVLVDFLGLLYALFGVLDKDALFAEFKLVNEPIIKHIGGEK